MIPLKNAIKSISLRQIFIGSFLTIAALSALVISLTYFRLSQMNREMFSVCGPADPQTFQHCANQIIYLQLADSQWISIQFCLFTLTTALICNRLFLRNIRLPLLQAGIIGLISGLILLVSVEPGRLAGLSALSGALLGGLFAHRRLLQSVPFRINQ